MIFSEASPGLEMARRLCRAEFLCDTGVRKCSHSGRYRADRLNISFCQGGEEKARASYDGLLDIREVAKLPRLATRGGCWFENGDSKIHLGVEEIFRPALKTHIRDPFGNRLELLEPR